MKIDTETMKKTARVKFWLIQKKRGGPVKDMHNYGNYPVDFWSLLSATIRKKKSTR